MLKKKIFEIDLLKMMAIILMVVFHIVYDLREFVGLDIEYSSGFWYWIGKIAALLFIFLAGINSGLGKASAKRGFLVIVCGMIITLVTFIFFRSVYIKFGILHLLGVCMIIAPWLKKMNSALLVLSSALIIYLYFGHVLDNTSFILFFHNVFGGPTLDYYPLFPYISLFIFGIFIYKTLYYQRTSLFGRYTKNKVIAFLSKYSLLIYLIHQPIIVGLIFVFKGIFFV